MIKDFDRRFYIGGSDIDRYILSANRQTKTWQNWWAEKCDIGNKTFSGSSATRTGTMLEHSILKTWNPDVVWDEQIIYRPLMLRINYDGRVGGWIYEVKCHRHTSKFDKSKYEGQVTAQAWVYERMAEELGLPPFEGISILEYSWLPDEENREWDFEAADKGEIPVDKERINEIHISYKKEKFKGIQRKLKPLARQLRRLTDEEDENQTEQHSGQDDKDNG